MVPMSRFTRRNLLQGAASAPAFAQGTGSPLNVIHIGVDTWGTHHLGAYGHGEYITPNVDRLMAKSARFLDAYPQALPTLPARRAIYTGRQVFPSMKIAQPDDPVKIRGWHQLYADDVTVAEALSQAGYMTAFVSDLYHQFKPGKNFTRGFDSWQFIRGQEWDKLRTAPRGKVDLARYSHPAMPQKSLRKPGAVYQYLLNRQDWKTEDDWLAAQVFRTAENWLRDNVSETQPFYLHIESFSPHEFWDPPEAYYRMYFQKDYNGPTLIHPPASTAKMSPLEVEHAKAMYAGLVTFTDSRIGKFLQTVEQLGLMKNTVIVFVADHGTMMGEQGQLHKGETRLRVQCTNVPLSIYHPRENWAGHKIAGFVSHTDLMPTILDLTGTAAPGRVTGESLRPLMTENLASKREFALTGWGEHASIRTPEWNYHARWSAGPKFEELYDRGRDPLELKSAAEAHPKVCAEFRKQLEDYVAAGWAVTKGRFHSEVS